MALYWGAATIHYIMQSHIMHAPLKRHLNGSQRPCEFNSTKKALHRAVIQRNGFVGVLYFGN